jgi:translation initiation factor 2 subunit 1
VSAEEVVKCEEQYEKGRAVDSILTQVAKRRDVTPESLYEAIAWPLHKKYGHSYEAFKLSIQEPEAVFDGLAIEADTLVELKHTIARRLTPKPVKVRADIEVTNFYYEGIESVRRALKAGEALSTEEVPIKVRLVAPPLYVMSTTSTDKVAAIDTMEKAVAAITASIKAEKGEVVVKMAVSVAWMLFGLGIRVFAHLLFSTLPIFCFPLAHAPQPKVVSETDDAELKKLMEQFEKANMDVAGDDDSEEDE